MFDNIGGKIKTLAMVCCWEGIIGSVFAGILCLYALRSEYALIIGLPILFGGPLVFWVVSLFVYGFGELIEKATMIEKSTRLTNADNNKHKPTYDNGVPETHTTQTETHIDITKLTENKPTISSKEMPKIDLDNIMSNMRKKL